MAFLKTRLEVYCDSVRNNKHMVNDVSSKESTESTKISNSFLKKTKIIHYTFFFFLFIFKGEEVSFRLKTLAFFYVLKWIPSGAVNMDLQKANHAQPTYFPSVTKWLSMQIRKE